MTTSQEFESYVPVYDAIPDKWDDARPFLVEQLKKITNAVNVREIGFLLDEELLSGKQFIPTASVVGPSSSSSQQFRTVFRKVIPFGAITTGANSKAHGIGFDSNFTLIMLWASANTTSAPFLAETFANPATITMDDMNITITSPQNFDRCNAFVEYLLEV